MLTNPMEYDTANNLSAELANHQGAAQQNPTAVTYLETMLNLCLKCPFLTKKSYHIVN